jgi:hypothetical protein
MSSSPFSDAFNSMTPEEQENLRTQYQRAYGDGTGSYFTYSRDQFHRLTDSEPYPIKRNGFDNPPFLWPSKQYMDSAGNSGTIQRGYMRSLISDPLVDIERQMKNRRLFFQFNPQVLVRSVQQTPGAMNPLLQDPAQLLAPVPGTTSFGFELMFNREHEVNAGYNDPTVTDWLTLPNGQQALVSEIGVLADLMILDSITGQGLSEDMIGALAQQTQRQYKNLDKANEEVRKEREEAGITEPTLDYAPIKIPGDEELSALFNANIGNSAFLNPQPFRVLFSSLFMVEGVATSVEVVFQKFSRTMVPTQCKVTINMYALYLGFSKPKTFIFDNLKQAAAERKPELESNYKIKQKFLAGVKQFNGRVYSEGADDGVAKESFPSDDNPYFKVEDIKITDQLKDFLKDNEVKEANFSFDLLWHFSDVNSSLITDTTLRQNRLTLKQNGTKVNFNAKGTKQVGGLYPITDGESGKNIFQNEVTVDKPITKKYISYRIIMVLHALNKNENAVFAEFEGTTVYNAEWTTNDGENMKVNSTYRYQTPTSGASRIVAE